MIRPVTLLLLSALALAAACPIGSTILEVGKPCTSDSDCEDLRLECVPADSPNADRVCMPIEDENS